MSKEIKPPEARYSQSLFEQGIGYVALFRFKASGVHAAVVLLDVYCLGVKNAFTTTLPWDQYPEPFLTKLFAEGSVSLSPGVARTLIEEGVAYAARFRIQPHPDYAKVRNAFSKISAEALSEPFVFGKDGKPFFIAGPDETPAQCERILSQLHEVCGEGNYDYLFPVGSADEQD